MTVTTDTPQSLSRRRKVWFFLTTYLVILLLFFSVGEIIVRSKGITPWPAYWPNVRLETAHGPVSVFSQPGLYHTKHPTLGYFTKPGEFRFILRGGYTFKTTHLSSGLRITHPLETYPTKGKKETWLFGCSFTQGWTLNDEETYAWLLQKRLSDYEVINFGVDGYSTLQSLLQCREAIQQGRRPAVVVLAYGTMHDERNTQTRTWMKTRMIGGAGSVYGSINLPYARLSQNGKPIIDYIPLKYFGSSLLRHSAFANYLDETYNRSLETTYRSQEVSLALIEEFSQLCKANGIAFVVAGIALDAKNTLQHCEQSGIMTVDIAVDSALAENNNLPYDVHPSAIANQQYSRKLEAFLCNKLVECGPPVELVH